MDNKHEPLLRVEHLKQYFKMGPSINRAVDDVSFEIEKGEIFGLVGESGCGKTTTGRTIINLYDPTGGNIYFKEQRISSCDKGEHLLLRDERAKLKAQIAAIKKDTALSNAEKQLKIDSANAVFESFKLTLHQDVLQSKLDKQNADKIHRERRSAETKAQYEKDIVGASHEQQAELKRLMNTELEMIKRDSILTQMQMIFQDPIASINPRMTVREIIAEGLIVRGVKDKQYIDKKVYEMLDLVGLVPEHASRYPHEFSGGQRQRIGIARAIIMEPELIIADEPISALDVSVQAQVINLLNELRNRMGLTILFIAHNLSVVKYFSDRIGVMYFGKIVELASAEEIFRNPLHPYTQSLLSAIPYPDPHFEKQRKRVMYNQVTAHDYSVDKPSFQEVSPKHFVLCNAKELAQYRDVLK